mmetsp:Transcript_10320/g.15799  ORF Transcript_10320/g.15799 Transcript_10320/m.15799 type:complete len:84 (+) Transcript_10320:4283-4534(+)
MCLHLTQNMQLYSEDALCNFNLNQFFLKNYAMRFGIGYMHHIFRFEEQDRYNFEAYIKYNNDITQEMSANFRYLLFNFNENRF